MAEYKYIFNLRTGKYDLVPSAAVITYKAGVANAAALPTEDNEKNDGRITADDGHLHVWDGSAWQDQGDIIDLYWTSLVGKPLSIPDDIDNAVLLRHTQNTDSKLIRPAGTIVDVEQLDFKSDEFYPIDLGTPYTAQTFVALRNGEIPKIAVIIRAAGTPDAPIILELRTTDGEGKPTSTVLDSVSKNSGDLSTPNNYTDFTFSSPITGITAGTKYAIVLRTAASTGGYEFRFKDSKAYAEGDWFDFNDPNWTLDDNLSYAFKVYITLAQADLIDEAYLKTDLFVDDGIKIDGRDLSVDGTKLDGIEESAVALATVKSDSDIADALSKKHTQNTDTGLSVPWGTLSSQEIVNKQIWGNKTFYVNPDTGDDGTSDPTNPSTPFQHIQQAVNWIPPYLNGAQFIIYLQDSLNYNENVVIEGKVAGSIKIYGVSNDPTKVLWQRTNQVLAVLDDAIYFRIRGVSIRTTSNNGICMNIDNNAGISMVENCLLGDNGNTGTRGINAVQGSTIFLKDVGDIDSNKVEKGVWVYMSKVQLLTSVFGDTNYYLDTEGEILLGKDVTIDINDYNDAIATKHTQNTDGYLDFGGANQIAANEIPKKLLTDIAYYLSPSGDDSTGDGSSGNPFKTLNHALSLLPKNLNGHYAEILLKDGTWPTPGFDEPITISDFYGGGYLWIYGESGDYTKVLLPGYFIQAANCSVDLEIWSISVRVRQNNLKCFNFYNCSDGWIGYNGVGDNGNTGTVGFLIHFSNITLDANVDIDSNKVANGIEVLYSSRVDIANQSSFGDTFIKSGSNGLITDGSIVAIGGKVGIGELSLDAKLHITDATPSAKLLRLDGSGGTLDFYGAGGKYFIQSSNELEFVQNVTPRLKFNYDGNIWLQHSDDGKIGIGTQTPTGKVHIYEADSEDSLLKLEMPGGTLSFIARSGEPTLQTNNEFGIRQNDTKRLFILYDGSVHLQPDGGKVSIGNWSPVADFVQVGANGNALLAGYQYPSAWSSGLLIRLFDETGQGWGYDLIPGLSSGGAALRIKMAAVTKAGAASSISQTLFDVNGSHYGIGLGGFSESGTVAKISNIYDTDKKLLVLKPSSGQTANQIEWQNSSGTPIGGVNASGELKIKVYKQDAEPTLSGDEFMAVWVDTNDNYESYLIFRRAIEESGLSEQVKMKFDL